MLCCIHLTTMDNNVRSVLQEDGSDAVLDLHSLQKDE